MQPGGNILQSEIQELIKSIWNKEELSMQRNESSLMCVFIKRATKVTSNYRGISVLQTTYKIVFNILTS